VNKLCLIIFSGLFFISGCKNQKKRGPVYFDSVIKKEEVSDLIDHQVIVEREAKLIDIPVPFNVKPLPIYFSQDLNDNSCSLGYSVNSQFAGVKDFYLHEMDRLGWKNTFCISGFECLIGFEKPSRFCIVSLRPPESKNFQHDNSVLVLFTGNH